MNIYSSMSGIWQSYRYDTPKKNPILLISTPAAQLCELRSNELIPKHPQPACCVFQLLCTSAFMKQQIQHKLVRHSRLPSTNSRKTQVRATRQEQKRIWRKAERYRKLKSKEGNPDWDSRNLAVRSNVDSQNLGAINWRETGKPSCDRRTGNETAGTPERLAGFV